MRPVLACLFRGLVFNSDLPYSLLLIPARLDHLGAELNIAMGVVAIGKIFKILLNFRARRKKLRPVRLGVEAKRIEVRGNVAGNSGL